MYPIYSTEVLFFNTNPAHIDSFVPTWHKFRNSITAKIRRRDKTDKKLDMC